MLHTSIRFSHLVYNRLTFEITGKEFLYIFSLAYVNIGIEHFIFHGNVIIEWYFKTDKVIGFDHM